MAKPRSTKRDVEAAKRDRAARKRDRKADGGAETDEASAPVGVGEPASTDEILTTLAQLHEAFAAEQIDFVEFETTRDRLLARLDVA